MAAKFSGLFLVGFIATMVIVPYMMAEARYLPTRGNEDRLTRLKELLTDVSDFIMIIVQKYLKKNLHLPTSIINGLYCLA